MIRENSLTMKMKVPIVTTPSLRIPIASDQHFTIVMMTSKSWSSRVITNHNFRRLLQQTRMDFPEETPAPKTSVWSEFEPGHSDTSLPDFTFLERLRQMQWAVKLIVIYDLLINVGFHVISILVLIDLHALNETGKCSLVLDAPYYDNKAHFWTLYGCCLDLNLNTTSVLLWGLLIFAIGKGDPTWAKAWVMMKRIVIFVMLPPIAAIAFGGETTLAIFSSIFFLFYYRKNRNHSDDKNI